MTARIFKENIDPGNEIILCDDDFHYLKNVIRIQIGENLEIFNEFQLCKSKVRNISKKNITCLVEKRASVNENLTNVSLMQCIIKGDKMMEIVDSAVQLGIKQIIPIISQNTYVKNINYDRANAIAKTALQQSGGFAKTTICQAIKITDAITSTPENTTIIYGDLSSDASSPTNLKNLDLNNDIVVLVGPEGGLTKQEHELLKTRKNALGIRIGSRVLRAENAAISLMTLALSLAK